MEKHGAEYELIIVDRLDTELIPVKEMKLMISSPAGYLENNIHPEAEHYKRGDIEHLYYILTHLKHLEELGNIWIWADGEVVNLNLLSEALTRDIVEKFRTYRTYLTDLEQLKRSGIRIYFEYPEKVLVFRTGREYIITVTTLF